MHAASCDPIYPEYSAFSAGVSSRAAIACIHLNYNALIEFPCMLPGVQLEDIDAQIHGAIYCSCEKLNLWWSLQIKYSNVLCGSRSNESSCVRRLSIFQTTFTHKTAHFLVSQFQFRWLTKFRYDLKMAFHRWDAMWYAIRVRRRRWNARIQFAFELIVWNGWALNEFCVFIWNFWASKTSGMHKIWMPLSETCLEINSGRAFTESELTLFDCFFFFFFFDHFSLFVVS